MVSAFGSLQDHLTRLAPAGGGPWSLNLRDLIRWCQALSRSQGGAKQQQRRLRVARLLFVERFRSHAERADMDKALMEVLGEAEKATTMFTAGFHITSDKLTLGRATLDRRRSGKSSSLSLLREQLPVLESLALCVQESWIPLLVGPVSAGKTRLVSCLAEMAGQRLHVLTVSSLADTSDLVGGFEQSNNVLRLLEVKSELVDVAENAIVASADARKHLETVLSVQQAMEEVATSQRVKEGKKVLRSFVDYLSSDDVQLGE